MTTIPIVTVLIAIIVHPLLYSFFVRAAKPNMGPTIGMIIASAISIKVARVWCFLPFSKVTHGSLDLVFCIACPIDFLWKLVGVACKSDVLVVCWQPFAFSVAWLL